MQILESILKLISFKIIKLKTSELFNIIPYHHNSIPPLQRLLHINVVINHRFPYSNANQLFFNLVLWLSSIPLMMHMSFINIKRSHPVSISRVLHSCCVIISYVYLCIYPHYVVSPYFKSQSTMPTSSFGLSSKYLDHMIRRCKSNMAFHLH